MKGEKREKERAIEWLRDIFEADLSKLGLSLLIILSLLPYAWIRSFDMVFFGIFSVEVGLRIVVLRHALRNRKLNKIEIAMIVLDIVATLSFLPLEAVVDDTRFLRIFRLSRMVMLVSYWGNVVRDVWIILAKRERRYQLTFVASVVMILAFLSAILLDHFESLPLDFNEDGIPDTGANGKRAPFGVLLWWSFRQLQDPGNLLKDSSLSLAFIASFVLTIAGIFVIAFFIGIGTSVVEELVETGRQRRIGLRRHTVIANIGPNNRTLVDELVEYYAKSFRSAKIAVMGNAARRYPFLHEDLLRRIRYRQGKAISKHDLLRVDTDQASRVILLGHEESENSDSEVISQILSVREVSPDTRIYAEILRADNIHAARSAGQEKTVPILAQRFVALLLADIVIFPGVDKIYGDLICSRGDEIYTCFYGKGMLKNTAKPTAILPPFGELLTRCYHTHGVILLGYCLLDDTQPDGIRHIIVPGTTKGERFPAVPPVDKLHGFFGISRNFDRLKDFVLSLPEVSAKAPPQNDTPIPEFSVDYAGSSIEHLLICGFHEGIIDFCEQMVLFAPSVNITVMVPDSDRINGLATLFEERSEEPVLDHRDRRVAFVDSGQGQVHYRVANDASRRGIVQILAGDWADERTLFRQQQHRFDISKMGVILLAPTFGEEDPDARTALSLLKLIKRAEESPDTLNANLRIVCEVQSTEKAELLESRFAKDTSDNSPNITILGRERTRNAFLAQSVFVPTVTSIFQELLTERGNELYRLRASTIEKGEKGDKDNRVVNFGHLLNTLYHRDEILVVGIELDDGRVVVNPDPKSDDYFFSMAELRYIYAIGNNDAWKGPDSAPQPAP
jgi:hypothetical protein